MINGGLKASHAKGKQNHSWENQIEVSKEQKERKKYELNICMLVNMSSEFE